jgi:hypothetical protein
MPSMTVDSWARNAALDLNPCGYQSVDLLSGRTAGEGNLAAFRVLLPVVSVLLPWRPAVTQSRGSLLRGCQLDCSSPSRLQAVVNA